MNTVSSVSNSTVNPFLNPNPSGMPKAAQKIPSASTETAPASGATKGGGTDSDGDNDGSGMLDVKG